MLRVLIADSDPIATRTLVDLLEEDGFATIVVSNGSDAIRVMRQRPPDVVLLDLVLPGMSGIDLCRLIRLESNVPILMLTSRSDTIDVVIGLESGADDYVVKPFCPRELVARIRAIVRRHLRQWTTGLDRVTIGDLLIDMTAHEVRSGDVPILLTPVQFELLATMARYPGRVFTREDLAERVWGSRDAVERRVVTVHVQRLRNKIEQEPKHPAVILTVRGVGYCVSVAATGENAAQAPGAGGQCTGPTRQGG